MSSPIMLQFSGPPIVIEAIPLTREAFAPFGDVIENPRPTTNPSSFSSLPLLSRSSLPFNPVPANQGSAIKYQHVSRPINLYSQAPSGRPGEPVMNIFVCAARVPLPPTAEGPPSEFHVSILERHPYTTQTFTPLTADPSARYLVIVAPTLPPDSPGAANLSSDGPDAEPSPALPTPASIPSGASYPRPLPGPGMPDLKQMRAYVATASQAVTYGAGTWHAPMVALGMEGTAVDFVVSQFANGVVVEDCQEVVFGPGVTVKVPPSAVSGKREARAFKL